MLHFRQSWTLCIALLVGLASPLRAAEKDTAADDAVDFGALTADDAEPANDAAATETPAPTDDAASAAGAAKCHLQYKFKPGDVLRWEVIHRAAIDTTIQGTNQTAETRSTSVKAWKITAVNAKGEVTLVHSVESIDMWQKLQGRQEVRYNSLTDSKVPPGYEDVAKAVGVPLTVLTMDKHGNVLKREEKRAQVNASATPITIPLPDKAVAVGHTWSVPVDMDVVLHSGTPKKIHTRQQFTLEKIAAGLATIRVESQVLTPVSDPAIEAQLVQRLPAGTLKFDIDRGLVASQQLDLDRRVIGFSGASSSMHCLTRFTEELLPVTATASTASKTGTPKQRESVAKKPAPPVNSPAAGGKQPVAPKKSTRR